MNIIAGKQYVTACGLITPPLKKLAGFEEMFDVGFGNPLLWKKNGIYIGRHDDPMLNIVKEHFQVNLLALGMLLVDRGVFTQEEFIEAAEEAKKIIEKETEDAG